MDGVLSKPTAPERRIAVLPECGSSIVHILYQELASWFPNLWDAFNLQHSPRK
jgi:hypothetical protein